MARIDALPSIEIIRGYKKILDFYLWRGLPCVRAWPRYRPARQTDASLAAALLFGAIIKAYALLANQALQAYRADALDQPRTARDIMVTGVYGNLHEASMSNFLDLLTQCRDFLSNLTDLLHALDSIDTDEIVVNVDQSVLPPLAATTTNQTTQITALQKIEDLQDALESKALDRLLVRGMDQILSIDAVLALTQPTVLGAANSFADSDPVPAGKYWKITNVQVVDVTSATTGHLYLAHHDGNSIDFHHDFIGFAAGRGSDWAGEVWLDPSDVIRVYFLGSLNGDTCHIRITGLQMTIET